MLGSHILYVDYFTDMIYIVSMQVSVVCHADCSHAMPLVCFENSEFLKNSRIVIGGKSASCWMTESILISVLDKKYHVMVQTEREPFCKVGNMQRLFCYGCLMTWKMKSCLR